MPFRSGHFDFGELAVAGHSCVLPPGVRGTARPTSPLASMSGKDFYEDDSGDAGKYYRPDAPAQASFFSGAPPAAAGTGAPGVLAQQSCSLRSRFCRARSTSSRTT